MAKYYALVAGLPQLTIDSPKPPYSTASFGESLEEVLTKPDRALLHFLQREGEHAELLDWIISEELPLPTLREEVSFTSYPSTAEEDTDPALSPKLRALRQVATSAYQGKRFVAPQTTLVATYQARFVYDLFHRPPTTATEDEQSPLPRRYSQLGKDRLALEDLLSSYYYGEAEASSSAFVREWSLLNKHLRNILVVFTCRRLGWEPSSFIVGQGLVEERLRTSQAKDFELSERLPYLPEVLRIAEERDIARRERLIDLLKWRWMEDWTFDRVFEVDSVLCHYLRLTILERWSKLDQAQGEATFRHIVHSLKGESARVLQDFKHSQGHK